MVARISITAVLLVLAIPSAAGARLIAYESTSCAQGGTQMMSGGPSEAGAPAVCTPSIWLANADGSEPRRLTNAAGGDHEPTWSADGSRIVYTSTVPKDQGPGGSVERIWSIGVDGSNRQPLTSGGTYGQDAEPQFSPDGTRIAFASSRVYDDMTGFGGGSFGPASVFTMAADGSDVRQLTPRGTVGSWPVWSPDGSRLYFDIASGDPSQAIQSSDVTMVSTDPVGGDPRTVLVGDSLTTPRFSPNGRFVAFQTVNWDVFVADLVTGASSLVSPPYVLLSGWSPSLPATLRLLGYRYEPDGRQVEDDYELDMTAAHPDHVAVAPLPGSLPVEQPDPGGGVTHGTLTPLVVAVAQLGPPSSFSGGPLPPDPWYPGDAGAPLPPAARHARQVASRKAPVAGGDPRDALRFVAVAPGGLAVVRVSLGRRIRRGRCRFLTASGRLHRADACGAVHLVSTGGRAHWDQVVAGLPHGTYVVRFQAVDKRHRRSKLRRRPLVVRV
jgi:hypothetical protein